MRVSKIYNRALKFCNVDAETVSHYDKECILCHNESQAQHQHYKINCDDNSIHGWTHVIQTILQMEGYTCNDFKNTLF